VKCRDCETGEAAVGLYDRIALCGECRERLIAGLQPLWIELMTERQQEERVYRAVFGEDHPRRVN